MLKPIKTPAIRGQVKRKILFAMIMGWMTTGIVSFTLIMANLGLDSTFISRWLRSWTIAYLVAIPVILIFSPKVQLLVERILQQKAVEMKEP